MNIEELVDNFELLDDWEDKYRYLIDLGERLPPLASEYKNDNWIVSGCQSQVWLVPQYFDNGKMIFSGDSDAAIVRGLIHIVLIIFNGKTKEEIKQIDVSTIFSRLGLEEHLSPSRRNGLNAMIEKIHIYAS